MPQANLQKILFHKRKLYTIQFERNYRLSEVHIYNKIVVRGVIVIKIEFKNVSVISPGECLKHPVY